MQIVKLYANGVDTSATNDVVTESDLSRPPIVYRLDPQFGQAEKALKFARAMLKQQTSRWRRLNISDYHWASNHPDHFDNTCSTDSPSALDLVLHVRGGGVILHDDPVLSVRDALMLTSRSTVAVVEAASMRSHSPSSNAIRQCNCVTRPLPSIPGCTASGSIRRRSGLKSCQPGALIAIGVDGDTGLAIDVLFGISKASGLVPPERLLSMADQRLL